MGDISSLNYPKRSHRKIVTLPEDSVNLAEFFGIMMGDGGINNSWQVKISLNSVKDKQYSYYISNLSEKLFEIKPVIKDRATRLNRVITLNSVSLVDFLVAKGLPKGNKLMLGLSIPEWILSNREYRIACLRGLMDTDGCLFIHKHKVLKKEYKNIGLCFSSHSSMLLSQFGSIFEEFGIFPHISTNGKMIYLYKAASVAKYLEVFGSSNERITNVYDTWRGARVV